MWQWLEDLASSVVDVAKSEARVLNDLVHGDFADIWRELTGSHGQLTKHGTGAGDLVDQVQRQGDGGQSLERARQLGVEQSGKQNQIETESRQMASALESAWTGNASEAARQRIVPLSTTAASASATLTNNSNTIGDQLGQFSHLKSTMHADVTNDAPERDFWDKATPWNTSTEDKINERNKKVLENKALYEQYTQQTNTVNQPNMKIDYGQLGDEQSGGDFKVDDSKKPPEKPPVKGFGGEDEHKRVPGPGDFRKEGFVPPQPRPPLPPPVNPPDFRPGTVPGPNDHTSTSSYVPPSTSSYQPPNIPSYQQGSIADRLSSGGGQNSFGLGGFGPTGGGGSSSGAGLDGVGKGNSGRVSGSIGSEPGAGKGTGAAEPSSRGGANAASAAGRGGPGGASGKQGMSGMGGAGQGGKGKGGEDKEHKRASYLQEQDADKIFGGTEEKPVPPTIGA
ncbi:hypothetical protein [Amycolatopsis sp. NPDC058986]|uniref:hypothetical protein n=1 Tax=unclassified Amycolatopsis TaxID=2618356 RepID=UPI00366F19D8